MKQPRVICVIPCINLAEIRYFCGNDKNLIKMKVAVIGAGNMGSAIIRGLVSAGTLRADQISVSNPTPGKLDRLSTELPGIYTSVHNRDAIVEADMIVLAVKPWLLERVLLELAPSIDFSYQIIVSIASGITLDDMARILEPHCSDPILFRVIPNTAIAVGSSMTFICSSGASDEEIEDVRRVFSALGRADVIEERLMGAATALCSCGIAYAMRYIRAATEGAVELGLRPDDAKNYVMQTLVGAVDLLRATGANPETEIDRVTTPGGVTIKGLNAMERCGFTTSVIEGLKASVNK